MVTLADSLTSSSARPLKVRMRPDLIIRKHHYQGQPSWVVKDPVGLKYFRFRDEEHAILTMLDGHVSLDQLKDRYEARFPPQKITTEEIARFIGNLHQSGLILTQRPGQGAQLLKRSDERKRQRIIAALTNILSLRFRGVDPQRFLTWLLRYTGWFFSPAAVFGCILLGLCAAALVTVRFDMFRARLPAFHEFFAAGNWIYLGGALVVTKILHELGHGLSCRHFGGECHEIGVMMLVLTPCLYCDVSDSWMLPSKWRRAAIGAAGMYVELVIASIATFVWWSSAPGLLNNMMLSVMFVCSVSTVMFNANPLLRYDGYYILSDLLEIPNLRQKATAVCTGKLGAWCLGLEEHQDRYLPRTHHALFALYTIAAVIYRWVVVLAILYFLYHVLEPYGLKVIGQMFAIFSIGGMIGQPLWGLKKFFAVPGRWQQVKRPRLYATLGIAAALLAAVLAIPLPHRVYCPVEIEPFKAKPVYIEVPGRLVTLDAAPGKQVTAGEVLARLENLDVQLEVAQLQGRCDELAAKLLALEMQRDTNDPTGKEAEMQVKPTDEALASAQAQLKKRTEDLAQLTLVAPCDGTVLPPALVQGAPRAEGILPEWSGTPFDKRNRRAWFAAGQRQPFCYVGDAKQLEATLVIDQADLPLVHKGQDVLLALDALAGKTLRGQIQEVSHTPLKSSSRRLSAKHGGQLDTRTDSTGEEIPVNPSYRARVLLNDPDGMLLLGMRGEARIHVASETIGARIWRYLTRTFYFKL